MLGGIIFAGPIVVSFFKPAEFGGVQNRGLVFLVFGGIGLALFLYGWNLFNDKDPKLSLTSHGIKDHRNGKEVRWSQYRGVRLYIATTNASRTTAIMYVMVGTNHGQYEETFDVNTMDHSAESIAELVRKRGEAALQRDKVSEDKEIAALLEVVEKHFEDGQSFTMVKRMLMDLGLGAEESAILISMVAYGRCSKCARCNLEYHISVEWCRGCGGSLAQSPWKESSP